MGEYKGSVLFHYSRGNKEALKGIMENTTIDEDDRKLAEECLKELENQKEKEEGEER